MTKIASKRRLLFVTEKWVDCDPALPLSAAFDTYFGSLRHSEQAAFRNFFVDETVLNSGRDCDEALYGTCREFQPDTIFIAMLPKPEFTPKRATLDRLRTDFDIKIAAIFLTRSVKNGVEWMEYFADHVDLVLVLDSYHNYQPLVRDPDRYLPIWLPMDPTIFHSSDTARPIDVSFLGSTENYPDRQLALAVVLEKGIKLEFGGGQRQSFLPAADYADTLRRSKITLNFARMRFGYPAFQCKGRVIEATTCGALLFEEKNDQTPLWLKPGEEYVEFSSEPELVEKIQHYLAHEDERTAIARAGHAAAVNRLGPIQFWDRVLRHPE